MRAVKVWEFPVRVIHWTNFLAIVGLCITGTYIHWPFLASSSTVPAWTFGYGPMGLARMVHLICGWALMLGIVGRFAWSLIGNRYAALSEFFPFLTAKGRSDIVGVLKYYALMSKRLPPHLGHNAVAAMAYLAIFILLAFQVVTGFALFGQYDPAGTAYSWFGWVFSFASNGYVRLAHYFVMFILFAFFINHIYAMWISDIAEKDGTAGSMFSGYKYEE